MTPGFGSYLRRFSLILLLAGSLPAGSLAKDYIVTGRVTERQGTTVANATISMVVGSVQYGATTRPDGTYSLRISGVYSDISGELETGTAFPVPFSSEVNIPFIISSNGDVRLAVYSMSGQKLRETTFPDVTAGSYRITWDGCNQHGSPQRPGFYVYAITFRGVTKSGRLIKAAGTSSSGSGTSLQPVMSPPSPPEEAVSRRINTVTSVAHESYYPVRLTDITVAKDTTIDFELTLKQSLPFKTSGNYIAMHNGSEHLELILKGINLGSSPPGYFPGEIAYAITPEMYERWIERMGESGFNSVRIYTLHPPVFYEKLAEYNYRHSDNPLLLFQGIWLEEVEDRSNAAHDLYNRTSSFSREIHEVIDCINGNCEISFRPGKAYGKYLTDVSQWTAGYILGREVSPMEVTVTNDNHPESVSFSGYQFSISAASATEVFFTRFLDEAVSFESQKYNLSRPVSISNWPTLDPLTHPTEIYSDEDAEQIDISKIGGRNEQAGLFASYHAYPYYPNFISNEESYRSYSDNQGRDSYLGYVIDLKSAYSDIPLVIAEFGVPSSWGSAHQSFSNMHHGGYSERQQGEKNMRMMNNILDAGCAGGFMFSWMDEWFKPTWIVMYLEAFGMTSEDITIPTRQLWHNLASPEQNFGLVSFDQKIIPARKFLQTDTPGGPVKSIGVTNDNSYLYVNLESNGTFAGGDTIMVAFDTYLQGTGESRLPNGKLLANRSEFMMQMVLGSDTLLHHVTQAYDMNGLTPRFDLSDHTVQMFRSTVTDGAPWVVMKWINDGFEPMADSTGHLPFENSSVFTAGERAAAAWTSAAIKIRIPWTLLYVHDPTQMKVIDGAESDDGGYNYKIITRESDGIALSVYCKGVVTSTTERFSWPLWLIVPETIEREKGSLQVIEPVLKALPGFAR